MIVPFVFVVEQDSLYFLWVFYKYMEFALANGYPIIAEDVFFEKPSVYEQRGEYPFRDMVNDYNVVHEFKKPTDDDMAKLKKVVITSEEKEKLIAGFDTKLEAYKSFLAKDDKAFEKMALKKVETVEKKYGKIDAIIMWPWFKGLENVCKKKKIKAICLENTTFRQQSAYQIKLNYFQFYNKYDDSNMDQAYLNFISANKDMKYLNRKELLGMFFTKESLAYLNQLNDSPKYEFGISIGPDWAPMAAANCEIEDKEVLAKVSKLVDKEAISLRIHPATIKRDDYKKDYQVDSSKNSLEWILKCRRIVSVGSNLTFEAMLLGKTAYNIGNNFPYRLGSINHLDYVDEKVCDIQYLNYLIFGYYVPYDLIFDDKYIKWRLTEPSEKEIFEYNQNYLFKKYGIKKNIFKLSSKDRLIELISKTKNLTKEEIQTLLDDHHCLADENTFLKNALAEEHLKYLGVVNSKSWKVTEPLRWISRKIHKN